MREVWEKNLKATYGLKAKNENDFSVQLEQDLANYTSCYVAILLESQDL